MLDVHVVALPLTAYLGCLATVMVLDSHAHKPPPCSDGHHCNQRAPPLLPSQTRSLHDMQPLFSDCSFEWMLLYSGEMAFWLTCFSLEAFDTSFFGNGGTRAENYTEFTQFCADISWLLNYKSSHSCRKQLNKCGCSFEWNSAVFITSKIKIKIFPTKIGQQLLFCVSADMFLSVVGFNLKINWFKMNHDC